MIDIIKKIIALYKDYRESLGDLPANNFTVKKLESLEHTIESTVVTINNVLKERNYENDPLSQQVDTLTTLHEHLENLNRGIISLESWANYIYKTVEAHSPVAGHSLTNASSVFIPISIFRDALVKNVGSSILIYDGCSKLLLFTSEWVLITEINLFRSYHIDDILIKSSLDEILLVNNSANYFVQVTIPTLSYTLIKPEIFHNPDKAYWWSEKDEIIFADFSKDLYCLNLEKLTITPLRPTYKLSTYANFYRFFTCYLKYYEIMWADVIENLFCFFDKGNDAVGLVDSLTGKMVVIYNPLQGMEKEDHIYFYYKNNYLVIRGETIIKIFTVNLKEETHGEVPYSVTSLPGYEFTNALILDSPSGDLSLITTFYKVNHKKEGGVHSYLLPDKFLCIYD